MQPIAEVRIPITLDKDRFMVFNVNTMCAYQELTGKMFMDTVVSLYDVIEEIRNKSSGNGDMNRTKMSLEVLRKIDMIDLRALLWSAVHDYDDNENPVWPLTLMQIGRYITPTNAFTIFNNFLRGQKENSPTKKEMGESQARPDLIPVKDALSTAENGGESSIELPVSAFI